MAKETPQATPDEQQPKSKLGTKTIIIVAVALIVEAGVILAVKGLSGGADSASATEAIGPTAEAVEEDMVEVELCEEMSVDNWVSGRTRTVVTLQVVARVEVANADALREAVASHQTQIKDRVRSLISAAQPDQIRDPQLQVIKRELQIHMEEVIPEGLISEILIPNWRSFPVD
ncbi:MAG: hypothetical protein JW936_05245 [Sedimentisphaerales bacterium]|nr:hypothetical protein [Sedimentisphaerales bacterium]